MRFQKGSSGNPGGKKPGTLNESTRRLRALLDEHGETLLGRIVELADGGDVTLLKFVGDKLLPNRTTYIKLDVDKSLPLLEQGRVILAGVLSGEIPIESGTQLLSGLQSLVRCNDLSTLDARLSTLESKYGQTIRRETTQDAGEPWWPGQED